MGSSLTSKLMVSNYCIVASTSSLPESSARGGIYTILTLLLVLICSALCSTSTCGTFSSIAFSRECNNPLTWWKYLVKFYFSCAWISVVMILIASSMQLTYSYSIFGDFLPSPVQTLFWSSLIQILFLYQNQSESWMILPLIPC